MKTAMTILLLALIGASAQAGNMQITGEVIDAGFPLPPGVQVGDPIRTVVTFKAGFCQFYNCGTVNAINVRVGKQNLHSNGGLVSWRIVNLPFYAVGDSSLFSALYDNVNNYIVIDDAGYGILGVVTEVPEVR